MSEGTRTPDRLDHNQELYQLSYAHHGLAHRAPARVKSSVPEGHRTGACPRQDSNLGPSD